MDANGIAGRWERMVDLVTGRDGHRADRGERRRMEEAALPPGGTRAIDIKPLPFTVDSNLGRLLR